MSTIQFLFLGWEFFAWTAASHPADKFFLGTLPDSKRDYNGLELSFRKRSRPRGNSTRRTATSMRQNAVL